MKSGSLPANSTGAEKVRNVIAGLVVWAAVCVAVVYLVLTPANQIELQPVEERVEQQVTAVSVDLTQQDENSPTDQSLTASTGPSESTISQIGTAASTDSADQMDSQQTASQPSGSAQQTSSLVYSGEDTQTSEPAESQTRETASVEVAQQPVSRPGAGSASVAPGSSSVQYELFVQVAAYNKPENAMKKRDEFLASSYPVTVTEGKNGVSLVLIGPYPTEREAKQVQGDLVAAFKLEGSFLRYVETRSNESTQVAAAVQDSTTTANRSNVVHGWYVRVGAFKNRGNARTSRLKVEKLNLPAVITREDELNVLLAGPFAEKNEAEVAKSRISKDLDIKDAYLVQISS